MSTDAPPLTAWMLPVGLSAAVPLAHGSPGVRRAPVALLWADIDAPGPPATVDADAAGARLAAPVFSEQELARACAAAAWSAVVRERAERAAARSRLEAEVLESVRAGLRRAEGALQRVLDDLAAGLGCAFAEALAAWGAFDAERVRRLETMLRATLVETLHAPSLHIVVPAPALEAVRSLASNVLTAARFTGELHVSADTALASDAVRIEWADGWAEAELDQVQSLLIDHLRADANASRSAASATAEENP